MNSLLTYFLKPQKLFKQLNFSAIQGISLLFFILPGIAFTFHNCALEDVQEKWTIWAERLFAAGFIGIATVFTSDFKDFTNQSKAKKHLLKSILSSAKESILVINTDGNIFYHNESATKMFGYTENELIGKKVEVLVPPRLREKHLQLRQNGTVNSEKRAIGQGSDYFAVRKDGSEFPVEISLGSFSTEEGNFITCFIIDITVRKEAEMQVILKNKALVDSENFLNSIIQNLPLYIMVREPVNMDVLLENKRILKLLGYSDADIAGKSVKDFIGPNNSKEQREKTKAANLEALETGKTVVIPEYPVLTKTGEERLLRLTKTPVFNNSGKALYLITIGEDITDWTHAQFEITKNHQLLIESQEIGNVGSFETDVANQTVILSDEFVQIMGIASQKQYYVDDVMKYVHPKDMDRVMQGINNAIKKNIPYDDTYRIIRPDGETRYIWLKAKAIYGNEGKAIRMSGVASDITGLKKAEDEIKNKNTALSKANEQLNLVNSDLEQFAYATSHEMQEPLRMIASHIQMVKRDIDPFLEEEKKKQMDFVISEAARMQQIMTAIREYINIDKTEEDFILVDAKKLVRYAEMELANEICETKAIITVEDLPEIKVKQAQIISLFRVLMHNAIKFRSDKIPEIIISATEHTDKYKFRVQDNGITINPKYHDRVFQIFKKLHGYYEYQGPGVGLAIAKKIVNNHGGDIWFESETGKGTAFFFTINK